MASESALLIKFYWRGKDKTGRPVKGEIMASSPSMAKAELYKKGIYTSQISAEKWRSFFALFHKKIHTRDITLFIRQLFTLLTAGIPIVESLNIIIESQSHPKHKKLFISIQNDIKAGTTLSNALKKFPRFFDTLTCHLVEVGEASGTLAHILEMIALDNEKKYMLKQKIKKSLTYPTIIIIVAIVVIYLLLLFVVPQFKEIFRQFNAELPAYTLMVIYIGEWVKNYSLQLILIGFFSTILSIKIIKASPALQNYQMLILRKIPIYTSLSQKIMTIRYARTLAITYHAGLPIVQALHCVASTMTNRYFHQAMIHLQQQIQSGSSLTKAMQTIGVFPALVVQMISIGEQSGSLDTMLNKVACLYEEEISVTFDQLNQIIEPFIMILLGVLVGGLVIALYLPIFKLGSVI